MGDQLIATSAVVYGSEDDYQGVMVRKGMQIVRLNVRGEKFNTVRIISPDFYLISISSSVYDYLCKMIFCFTSKIYIHPLKADIFEGI